MIRLRPSCLLILSRSPRWPQES